MLSQNDIRSGAGHVESGAGGVRFPRDGLLIPFPVLFGGTSGGRQVFSGAFLRTAAQQRQPLPEPLGRSDDLAWAAGVQSLGFCLIQGIGVHFRRV
jgi:hypothetical protein